MVKRMKKLMLVWFFMIVCAAYTAQSPSIVAQSNGVEHFRFDGIESLNVTWVDADGESVQLSSLPYRLAEDTVFVNVACAADDEFREAHKDWASYTKTIIAKVNDVLYGKFKIFLLCNIFYSWISLDENVGDDLIFQLQRDMAWGTNGITTSGNEKIHILIGWTTEKNLLPGDIGLAYVINGEVKYPIIMLKSVAQCFDDNIILHEIGHLYGLPDHEAYSSDPDWNEDCIMCNRPTYVYTWIEDGRIYFILKNVPYAFVTTNFYGNCHNIFESNRERYNSLTAKPIYKHIAIKARDN
jgi:hypothetical protein